MAGYRNFKRRADANAAECIRALRKCGIVVYSIDEPIDALCFYRRIFTVEFKNPAGRNKEQPSQVKWRELCEGYDAPHYIVRSVDEAIAVYRCEHEQK